MTDKPEIPPDVGALEELTAGMDPAELRHRAAHSIGQWAEILAKILSPEDAWRQLLFGAVAAAGTVDEVADMLRQAAADLEAGQFRPSIQ